MLGRFISQKGFIGRKTLLLMSLIFSLLAFCLLQKLTPSVNTSNPTTTITIHQAIIDQTYETPKDEQDKLPANSDLDPHVVNRFSAARQELESKGVHVEFKWYSTVGKQRWCPNNLQQAVRK